MISLTNQFGQQPAQFEIKPRFDYKGFFDPQNKNLANIAQATVTRTSAPNVSCSIQNGTITVSNMDTSQIGECEIKIPFPNNANQLDLTSQRGIGLRFNSDSSNILLTVRLWNLMVRDFKYQVPQTGEQTVLFGDPAVEGTDQVNGVQVDWQGNLCKFRQWTFDYKYTNQVYVYISNVRPNQTIRITLLELKSLQEKGSNSLVNPTVTINGTSISFPVALQMNSLDAPYRLEYNGFEQKYKVYTINNRLISQNPVEILTINPGTNSIQFNASRDPTHSQRAELKITTSNDEDNDGIPTNGDFVSGGNKCSRGTSYCDDNCPTNANPTQEDNDSDGTGNTGDTP